MKAKPHPYWKVPYMDNGKRKTVVRQAPHRRAAERGVPNHVGTAVEVSAPGAQKKKSGKTKKK